MSSNPNTLEDVNRDLVNWLNRNMRSDFMFTQKLIDALVENRVEVKNFIDMAEWNNETIRETLKELHFLTIDIGYLITAIKIKITLRELLNTPLSIPLMDPKISKSQTILSNPEQPYNVVHWKSFQKDFDDFFKEPDAANASVDSWKEPLYKSWSEDDDWNKVKLKSHNDLQTRVETILNGTIKQIFKGILHFKSRASQNEKMLKKGAVPNDGDIFYTLLENEQDEHVAEIKLELSYPITSEIQDSDVLIKVLRGLIRIKGFSQERAGSLIEQMASNMTSDANNGAKRVYSMVTSLKTTQVMMYDNENSILWISPPLGINNFLKAAFFVVSMQLKAKYSDRYKKLFERIKAFSDEGRFNPTIFDIPSSNSQSTRLKKSTGSNKSKDPNESTRSNRRGSIVSQNFNESSLLEAWQRDKILIGSGRTAYVFKVRLGRALLAYKMVNRFKHAYRAMEELENEQNLLMWLNKKKLAVVPQVHFFGIISQYKSLVMTFITGQHLESFEDMTLPMREACRRSVEQLHKLRVVHGDLESRNFVIVRSKKNKSYTSFIIDFGLARMDATIGELSHEYRIFLQSAGLS